MRRLFESNRPRTSELGICLALRITSATGRGTTL